MEIDDKIINTSGCSDICDANTISKSDDELELPALKRRPKRVTKPVQDKSKVVKYFENSDSETDEDDGEWNGEADQNSDEGDDSQSSDGDSDPESGEACVGSEKGSEDAGSDIMDHLSADVPADCDHDEEPDAEPVSITKEDLPFLFAPRAPGKRQIKVIQVKNDIAEKARDMSSDSSSEDEDWKAKQEDVKEQITGENEDDQEDVDMTNVPLISQESNTKPKAVFQIIERKDKKHLLSHEEALQASICCVCLTGPEEDNVLSCDSCGVTVHEGCYGHPPSDPEGDDGDTMWFCEPCIAHVDELVCELCPSKGGVMKATDSGRWAHMVCALYLNGVGFEDTTILEPIITTDLLPSKFGYKKCDLCEDERFAYTGIVVECDAGLCKSNFHVTCAQKLGFLMESSGDEEKGNPFFAYCKVHVDKDIARPNKKAYRMLEEHTAACSKEEITDNQILHHLKEKRKEYLKERRSKVVPAIMTERHPRALFGSVSAFTKLLKKAELFGLDTHYTVIDDTENFDKPIKVVKPDVSIEFAKQYGVRQKQRKMTVARHNYHHEVLMNLREEEHKLQAEIHELQKEVPKLSKKYEKFRKQAVSIWKFLAIVDPDTYSVPDSLMHKQHVKIKSHVINRKLGIKVCHACRRTHSPEATVDCDDCQSWFHFSCLDPPLTRNPKVNKNWAWFCTECTLKNHDAPANHGARPKMSEKRVDRENNSKVQSDEEEGEEVKTTKFGRSVKKPDHFTVEDKPKQKAKKSLPVLTQVKAKNSDRVVSLSAKTFETVCVSCSKSDLTQKLFCDFCKNNYHLQCTSGNYESGGFVCETCEVRTAKVPHLEITKAAAPINKAPIPSQKRKNIFELQYDLLQKKKQKESGAEWVPSLEMNTSADKSDAPDHTDTDDEVTTIPSVEPSPVKLQTTKEINPAPKANLFSNLIKDIQKAVAKVPEGSKMKLGMSSPVKSMKIVDQTECSKLSSDHGEKVDTNVEIYEQTNSAKSAKILSNQGECSNEVHKASVNGDMICEAEQTEGSTIEICMPSPVKSMKIVHQTDCTRLNSVQGKEVNVDVEICEGEQTVLTILPFVSTTDQSPGNMVDSSVPMIILPSVITNNQFSEDLYVPTKPMTFESEDSKSSTSDSGLPVIYQERTNPDLSN